MYIIYLHRETQANQVTMKPDLTLMNNQEHQWNIEYADIVSIRLNITQRCSIPVILFYRNINNASMLNTLRRDKTSFTVEKLFG